MEDAMPPELHIHAIKAIAPHSDGDKIVVRADAMLEDERTELEIAVTTDLAPAMALALLATTATARAKRDELEPALEVLAAAVVRSSSEAKVRLQLLFDKGAVLPLEMHKEAGVALSDGLVEYFRSGPQRSTVARS
jgi:hypothetical protein